MANTIIDSAMTYALMKRLVTPFENWPAYQLGIIDENGKVLKKRKTLNQEERRAWGRFDIMAANIKKIIQKIPGGRTRLGSIAAAAFLFKEGIDLSSKQSIHESVTRIISEDGMAVAGDTGGAANIVGGGNIAGVGVGPQGEPPGQSRLKKIRTISKRKQNVDR